MKVELHISKTGLWRMKDYEGSAQLPSGVGFRSLRNFSLERCLSPTSVNLSIDGCFEEFEAISEAAQKLNTTFNEIDSRLRNGERIIYEA